MVMKTARFRYCEPQDMQIFYLKLRQHAEQHGWKNELFC